MQLKICALTARIKKYKSITNKKRKKHDKMVLLTESKFNTIDFLVSKALKTTHILIMTNKFSKSKTLKMFNIVKWCRKLVDRNGILRLNERHIK